MLPPNIDDIAAIHIESLVAAAVDENRYLEYKQTILAKTSNKEKEQENKAEIAKDFTAMANTFGGYIIFGITERDSRATGTIDLGKNLDLSREILRYTQILETNCEPPLASCVSFRQLSVNSDKILIAKVARSFGSPHRVKSNNRFFRRNSNGVSEMDVWDLRSAFLETDHEQRIGHFVETRRSFFRKTPIDQPVPLSDGAICVSHLLPISSFLPNPQFISSEELHSLGLPGVGRSSFEPASANIDGRLALEYRNLSYVQVFHSGRVERVICPEWTPPQIDDDKDYVSRKVMPSTLIEQDFFDFVGKYTAFLADLGFDCPFLLCTSLFHTEGTVLDKSSDSVFDEYSPIQSRDELILRDIFLDDLDQPVEKLLKPMVDHLWNAYNLERCSHYDDRGTYNG